MKKTPTIRGLGVDVYHDNFDRAFRQFRKKIQKAGIIQEVRDRRYYHKPSEVKQADRKVARRKNELARMKNSKRLF